MGECFVKACKVVVLDLLIVIFIQNVQAKIVVEKMEETNNGLVTCVKGVIDKYYEKGKEITFIDIESDDNNIPKMINAMLSYSLISRKQLNAVKIRVPHQGYIIYARNAEDFVENFRHIKRESTWNPRVKFLIIIKILRKDELRDIFNQILHVHVTNVIVINGTHEADMYTYNPFENYACGRYFDRIIEYGQCSKPTVFDLYPNKYITGLINCTFSVAIPHLPPLTIFPSDNKTLKYQVTKGTEQFAFETMSELEKFEINYSYIDFAETSSMLDVTSKGIFNQIETNQTDVLFGYTWLTSTRSTTFDNLYAHLAFTDTLTYIVKKSGDVPGWMNLYLEFDSIVWIVLFFSFIVITMLVIVLLRTNDKVSTVLKLWDTLFLHGYSIQCRCTVKCVLLLWVWFAYLINAFYQSSLVSLTMNPSQVHQVSTEKDLIEHNFGSCVTPPMIEFLTSEAKMSFKQDIGNCPTLKEGIRRVSQNNKMFTITPLSIYQFNRYKVLDARGKSKVYLFSEPVMKLIYAIFLYKGFPMHKKLHMHSIYLRQSGLMDKHFNDLYYDQAKVHHRTYDYSFKARIIVPWNLMLFGCTLAIITFILELLVKNYHLVIHYFWF